MGEMFLNHNACDRSRRAKKPVLYQFSCSVKFRIKKISADQLFYCRQRGLSTEDAVSLIVNGFCKEVLKELPMEFAVEAQKLLAVSLEGSVG